MSRAFDGRGRLVAVALLGVMGCQPPLDDVLTDPSGQSIRLTAIGAIIGDTTLTDAEKRTQLQNLGITDEDLIDILIREGEASSSS